jgi:hypothetical protein
MQRSLTWSHHNSLQLPKIPEYVALPKTADEVLSQNVVDSDSDADQDEEGSMPADVGDELSNQEDESQRTTSQVASTSTPDSTGMDVDSDDEYDTPETRLKQPHFLAWILMCWINSTSPILWESSQGIFNLSTVMVHLCLHVFLMIFSMLKLAFSDSFQKDTLHSNPFLKH